MKNILRVDYYAQSQQLPGWLNVPKARRMQRLETYHFHAELWCIWMVQLLVQDGGEVQKGGILERRDQEKTLAFSSMHHLWI